MRKETSAPEGRQDRKSTRLNSSHSQISYAVFCLKKTNEIAAEYGVHPTQIAQWKKQALDGLPSVFSTRASEQQKSAEELIATLYQQIGQLKVQVDWLEKKSRVLH